MLKTPFLLEVKSQNDLNGGLEEEFWLKEFGVFARDGEEEILLYYASLGEYPQYVEAYENGKVNIKKISCKYSSSRWFKRCCKCNIGICFCSFCNRRKNEKSL